MVILMAGCFRWVKRRNQPTRDVKLVIIGLDNAGKTTTIACLEGEPPDGITPTVGFANAKLTMAKWNITIYDLGGGAGVRSVWQKYYAEIYGMIFTVDSGDHNRLVESKNVLNEIFTDPKLRGKPIVVFANKQDKDGALNEEEVGKQLALQDLSKKHNFKYNIFSCSAIQGYGKTMDKRIKTGLEWLLNAINQDYTVIDEKVTKESAIQQEQEKKERKERMERIRKLREEREKAAQEAGVAEEEEESDDDVVTNPFRSINEQVEITQNREKKAKERMKKIKDHQMKNSKDVKSEDVNDNSIKPKKDLNKFDDGDGEDENETDINETHVKKKKEKKKSKQKKNKKQVPEENSEVSNKKKKSKLQKNEVEDEVIDVNKDTENDIAHKYNNMDLNNKLLDNVKQSNGYVDSPQHNIIHVSSKENIREKSPPPQMKKKKKKLAHNEELDLIDEQGSDYIGVSNDITGTDVKKRKNINSDVNSYCINEKDLTDSRAELFLARSSESLDGRLHTESDCCNNKPVKGKDKKCKLNSEFHDVQDMKTEVKKKRRKKTNKTEPQEVPCTTYLENNTANGSLPPIRGVSKLEPIKTRGKLPNCYIAEDSSMPSWAHAKPNFDDDDVIT